MLDSNRVEEILNRYIGYEEHSIENIREDKIDFEPKLSDFEKEKLIDGCKRRIELISDIKEEILGYR